MDHQFNNIFNFYSQMSPDIWRFVESLRNSHKDKLDEFVYITRLMVGSAIAQRYINKIPHEAIHDFINTLSPLAGIAAWRTTQGIYEFDPDLFEEAWNTPIEGKIPIEILFRLPEWCIYIPTPGKQRNDLDLLGFFAYIDTFPNPSTSIPEYYFNIIYNHNGRLDEAAVPLLANMSLEDCLIHLHETNELQYNKVSGDIPAIKATYLETIEDIAPFLSLCLYIASQTNEINHPTDALKPAFPTPTKTKKGERYFPPDKPTQWEVGYRMGAALREARSLQETHSEFKSGQKAPARPHIRRAHWHTYWTGSRTQEQVPVLKWLPPIPVNLDLGDLVPTIRPVKEPVTVQS